MAMKNQVVAPATVSPSRALSESRRSSVTKPREYRRTLSQHELNQYSQQGFLSISGVTTATDVADVRSILDRLYKQHGREHGSIANLVRLAPELQNTSLFQSCLAIARQILGRTTMYAGDNSLYKEPHGKHGTPWHQDGAFHGKYFPNNTVAFWIPLQEATLENGCLHYIPLEKRQILLPHRPYYPNDRGSMMTDPVNPAKAVVCPLRIGDATIHGPLTLHSALANSTDFIRRTWLLTFRPWGKWGFFAPSRLLHRARLLCDRLISHATS
jgi:ectoine hydroxylase-related dioxygenase (phytanoyl-CoA dioxygenase family)